MTTVPACAARPAAVLLSSPRRRRRRRQLLPLRPPLLLSLLPLLLLLVVSPRGVAAGRRPPPPPFAADRATADRHLGSSAASSAASNQPVFVESAATSYDGYQQSWRMLGVYVDCSGVAALQSSNNENQHDGYNTQPCQRYILWAAYVDVNYQGGTVGEYQYWDATGNRWDTAACDATGNARCAKMDCHLSDTTTWSLLGIYKEAYYASQWFEQLFKHEGYCLWSSDTYQTMHDSYGNWPEGCAATQITDAATGTALYVDLQPGPNLTFAVYTDNICYTQYTGTDVTVDEAVSSAGYLSGDTLTAFNDAMLIYRRCNPCRTFYLWDDIYRRDRQLVTNDGDPTTTNGTSSSRRRRLDDFDCYDAAGYTNVNQCMKFATHTYMQAATWKDVDTALQQGAILEIKLAGRVYQSPRRQSILALEAAARMGTLATTTTMTTATNNNNAVTSLSSYMMSLASAEKTGRWLLRASIGSLTLAVIAFWIVLAWMVQRHRQRRNLGGYRVGGVGSHRRLLKEPLVPELSTTATFKI